MKAPKKLGLISWLLCIAVLCTIFPMGIVSNAQDEHEVVYQLCNTPLNFPSSSCTHDDTTVLSYPTELGGDCTVKCFDCGRTLTFATSTGMKNWWNHDGSVYYSLPLTQRDYTVGEKLYLWIQDLNESLIPDEKTITITGSDGATFTETWLFMGYFTFEKPGVYTVTIADKYNPLVCFEYTMNVTGSNGSGAPEDDGSCSHEYKSTVTPATCLVQGYTTYTCTACGTYYLDNYVDPIGHSYTNYLGNGDGALVAVCDRCDATDTVRDPDSDIVPSEATAYQIMVSLKDEYPEGMTWTDDNYYEWNGGIYRGGYGCAGFCFILSDAIFGDLPARKIEGNVTIDQLRVGDILRLNNDSHSVSVLEVHEDYIILAEGNYNSSIHWGRKLTAEEVAASDYYMTRYPEHVHQYSAVVTAPTCEERGYTTYTCDCGDSYVGSYTVATGHSYGVWYVTVAPQVGLEGEERRDCVSCDAYETRVLPAIGEYGVPGDANGDGQITMRDAVLIQQYLNGWDVAVESVGADVNLDGSITMRDAVLIQQYLNGWDVVLK